MYISFSKAVTWFSILNILITVCLDIVWIVVCTRQCFIFVRQYRARKRRPNLHPLHRDVQYLSQQMSLYNIETHIVKYVLVTLCLSVEVASILSVVVYVIIISRPLNEYEVAQIAQLQLEYPTCNFRNRVILFYYYPYYPLIWNVISALTTTFFMLLSLMTRYLAARYLVHPFRKTLCKYITWLVIQLIILAVCSTVYTIILITVISPLFLITNWIILVRDSKILSRALKSNLQQLKSHSNNIQLYNEQQSGYKVYTYFQKILLVSLFLSVVLITISILGQLYLLFSESSCLINLIYGLELHIYVDPTTLSILYKFYNYLEDITESLLSVSCSLPIISVTLAPIVTACIKRYRSRHYVWRYNYGNTLVRPLIRQ